MTYKRSQRRKWQRREQQAGRVIVPEWGRVHAERGRDVQIAYHPLAGVKPPPPRRRAVYPKDHFWAMSLDEAADKIADEYGDALKELSTQ